MARHCTKITAILNPNSLESLQKAAAGAEEDTETQRRSNTNQVVVTLQLYKMCKGCALKKLEVPKNQKAQKSSQMQADTQTLHKMLDGIR